MLTGRSMDQLYSHRLGLNGLKSALQALPRQEERLFVDAPIGSVLFSSMQV